MPTLKQINIMKKTIGIVGYKNSDANSFGVGISYLQWISQFGNPVIIMPWQEYVEVDLLLIPGGLDLNPAAFGAIPEFKTSNQDVFKQFFYDHRLKNYVENTPILGVCLGMQMLAAYFGSTICQHLTDHPFYSNPRNELVHNAYYIQNGQFVLQPGAKKNTFKKIQVNSMHHQGVYMDKLGEDLDPVLVTPSEKDNKRVIVEAFTHKNLPIHGVQFHPEETNCEYTASVIRKLLTYKDEPVSYQ